MLHLSTHTFATGTTALMGVGLPSAAEPPEWVHLLPAGSGRIETVDGRGPYHVEDPERIIAASFAGADKLLIDENHATDLAAPRGEAAPARGWITEMQVRADGIWGRVSWTASGKALLADQAYRGISPVFLHTSGKQVTRILRASLVNNPNLRGLATLHQEGHVTFQQKLAEKLGLAAEASEDAILAAIQPKGAETTALQSALPNLAAALGLDRGATLEAVTAAARAAGQDAKTTVPALQAQVTDLSTQLKALQDGDKLARAEAFVDGEIKAGRMGLNATNRAEFVAMHQENPERTEKLIRGFALASVTHTAAVPPQTAAGATAEDLVSQAKALQAAERAKGNDIDWAAAVRAVSEGKK